MFKSQVPFCFCSLAFAITMPSVANPGPPSSKTQKNVSYASGRTLSTTSKKKMTRISMPLPDQQGMKFVKHYIKNNDECLLIVKRRSEVPFSIIDSVLTRYGLPLELKYLAVIESELKTSAVSRVGAKGPWQFMPETAHALGLKVNRHSDERLNYYKSTRAAAKYLRDLHREFGDWLLVLAAYNGGPVPVIRAIHKAHSRDFWALQRYLPAESRDHVKKFIATAYYFETAKADTLTRPRVIQTAGSLPVAPASNRPVAATPNNKVPTTPKPQTNPESADEKFNRLMRESANSLQTSHELLTL